MHRTLGRGTLLALLGALVLAVPAQAAPVSFTLRVEGATKTLFEGSVTTAARPVDGRDGSGLHTCDGTNNGTFASPGPTVGTAMADQAARGTLTWQAKWNTSFHEFFLNTIDGETPNFAASNTFWGLYENGHSTSQGMCEVRPAPHGEILWAVTTGAEPVLHLAGPTVININQPASYTVKDASVSPPTPIAGARVAGAFTNGSGQASVSFSAAGIHTLKAAKPGTVRSNALVVCVTRGGGTCGTISIPNGARFEAGRAPRLLSGAIGLDSGNPRAVELRLARRSPGRCEFFSVSLGRLRRASCGRGWLFRVGSGRHWSFSLGSRLPAGSYKLDVVPFDAAGAPGRTRTVRFRVLPAPRKGPKR